jgi:hypothetical protein
MQFLGVRRHSINKNGLTRAAGDSGYAAAGTVRDFVKWRDNEKMSWLHRRCA